MKKYKNKYVSWFFPDEEEHFLEILDIHPEYQYKCKLLITKHSNLVDLTHVLDIGANVGLWARWFANNGSKIIDCFEPMPKNLECLRANLKDYKQVNIHEMALSNYSGTMTLYVPKINKNSGSATIIQSEKMTQETKVDCRPLDELNLSPTFIKLDVQGAEMMVLEGALETIKNYHPSIIIECENESQDTLRFLENLGYKNLANTTSDFLMIHSSRLNSLL